ncbi:hypothetical protein B0H67DRAFT_493982 [Lasiosphaeris hirsuta]|uniref:Uncharacterized protein n=1 Tax=Lasiosphaeris hirsuta TaxID=260670 RepID=A0AA40A8B8_9PEZI|nr:hypothetical protein B0H67DRAFT_493982 [Lasiosphaeris hirsuta]
MASFSRGLSPQFLLLVRRQTPCKSPSHPTHLLSARFLPRFQLQARSRLVQTASQNRPPVKPTTLGKPTQVKPIQVKPSPTIAIKPTGANVEQIRAHALAYAERLALKSRTIIYEAPSHFWFRFSSMSAALFCVGYSVYQYWHMYLHPPEFVPSWIPHVFGVVCMCMAGTGAYFLLGTTRIVRGMQTISVKSLLAAPRSAGKLPAALSTVPSTSPVCIEVEIERVVPFLPRSKLLFWPEAVELPFRMTEVLASQRRFAPGGRPSTRQSAQALRAEREAETKEKQYEMDHLMTAPFRDAKKAFSFAWEGMARAFRRDGFAQIKLNKANYKIDIKGAWALEDGRAMDRLLSIRTEPSRLTTLRAAKPGAAKP